MAFSLKQKTNFKGRHSEFYADVFLHIPSLHSNSITTLKLHKVILATSSPVLDRIFHARENMREIDLCLLHPRLTKEIAEIGISIIYGEKVFLPNHLEKGVQAFLNHLEVEIVKDSEEKEEPALKKQKILMNQAQSPSPPPAPAINPDPVRALVPSLASTRATAPVRPTAAQSRTMAPRMPTQTSSGAKSPPRPPATLNTAASVLKTTASVQGRTPGPVTTTTTTTTAPTTAARQQVRPTPSIAPPAARLSPPASPAWSDISSQSAATTVNSEDLDNFDFKGNF